MKEVFDLRISPVVQTDETGKAYKALRMNFTNGDRGVSVVIDSSVIQHMPLERIVDVLDRMLPGRGGRA